MLSLEIGLAVFPLMSPWKTCRGNFKEVIENVSMDVLGERPKKRRLNQLSHKTNQFLIERSAVKRLDPASDSNRSEYSKLNKKSQEKLQE